MRALMLWMLAAVLSGPAGAQITPVGLWKTIDDNTGRERSLVRIAEAGGVLTGKIERGLLGAVEASEVCAACTDDRKSQPLIGMEIIRGAKRVDGQPQWEGGQILDPDNGKVYRLRLTPLDGGKKLEVRGYIGMPMLGRTQTWIRVE